MNMNKKIEKEFEKWMKKQFEEPEWDEGYTRYDMLIAFSAGSKTKSGKKENKK